MHLLQRLLRAGKPCTQHGERARGRRGGVPQELPGTALAAPGRNRRNAMQPMWIVLADEGRARFLEGRDAGEFVRRVAERPFPPAAPRQ